MLVGHTYMSLAQYVELIRASYSHAPMNKREHIQGRLSHNRVNVRNVHPIGLDRRPIEALSCSDYPSYSFEE